MKLNMVFLLLLLNLQDCYSIFFSQSIDSLFYTDTLKESNAKMRAFGTIKFDPFQVLLSSEIPLSFEIYISQKTSLQVQVGYVFPARKESLRRKLYESVGENGNAKTDGMFYYRDCPYNNDGSIDIRTELRLFFKPIVNDRNYVYKSSYFAFQAMYRYYYYDNLSVYLGSPFSYNQTESKKANVYGLAFILGKQVCVSSLITDLYGGIGFKTSKINYTILGISPSQPPWFSKKPGQTGKQSIFSLYLSFGLRIGFEL